MNFPLKKATLLLSVAGLLFWGLHGTPSSSFHKEGEALLTLPLSATASIIELGPHYESEYRFLSEVYETEQAFELLGLNWSEALPVETEAAIEIRFLGVEGEWSDWQELQAEGDQPDWVDSSLWTYVITQESQAFQYRVFLQTEDTSVTPTLSDISFDAVDGGKTAPLLSLERMVFKNKEAVVSRKQWGADEKLRLSKTASVSLSSDWDSELSDEEVDSDPDMKIIKTVSTDGNGNKLLWPLEYPKKIKKIIIHHTATTANLDDPEVAMRAIYYYHAVTRGWGDIGYNYVVAPDGTVFEGRAGGDGVVAGHASGYNTGSVGIALLGNYETSQIPGELMQSLTGLIYEKADLHGISPATSGIFRGKSMLNVLAHRDVDATTCPGQNAYDFLPDIRQLVANALDNKRSVNSSDTYAFEEVGDRELVLLDPEGSSGISVKIKNTGTATWDKETYIVVNANSESEKKVSIPKDSNKRTAKIKETSVAPGKTATFSFSVSAEKTGGLAYFDMTPVFNGTKKTQHVMDLGIFVEAPILDFQVASSDAPSSMKPGESATVTVKLKNNGNVTWTKSGDNPVTLERVGTSTLVSGSTLASMKESTVKPGAIASFEFKMKAPSSGGTYTLYYQPKMKGVGTASSSAQIRVTVLKSSEDALIVGSSTDTTFDPGESKIMWVQVQNTSSAAWLSTGKSAFTLYFSKPKGVTVSAPIIPFKKLNSGAGAKIYFTVTAPEKEGDYTLLIRSRLGSKNLTKTATSLKITVGAEEIETTEMENPIRIKLTPSAAISKPLLTASSSFGVYDDDKLVKVFSANNRVSVSPGTKDYTVIYGSQKWTVTGPVRFVPEDGGIIYILNFDQKPAWNTALNDNKFRGVIEIQKVDSVSAIINELPLEDYLKGIAEISNDDPTEKIKTIIVLARSYAEYYLTQDEKFPGKPYDLEDDPDTSQKYLGYGYESRSPLVTAAVEATAGKVVTVNGKVVKTPYFSKSDGVATKSAKEVWGWTNTPWLVSVPDTYCVSTAFSGHGVGLSGCGATALAEKGWDYTAIIKYYYTGVEVSDL